MVQITTPPLPKQWDVVRCYCDYPHDKHKDSTHPALVLSIIPANDMGNNHPLVIVAVGTGTFDPVTEKRRPISDGEIPLTRQLCLSAGLKKETKFCFSRDGIFAFPWDNEFFRWDPQAPSLPGEPLFGSLNTNSSGFERFITILKSGPEIKLMKDVVSDAVQRLINRDAK